MPMAISLLYMSAWFMASGMTSFIAKRYDVRAVEQCVEYLLCDNINI